MTTNEVERQEAIQHATKGWDEWNEARVSPYRELPLDEIFAYAELTHTALMAKAATSPVIDSPTLRGFTWGHYEAHYGDLRNTKNQSTGNE